MNEILVSFITVNYNGLGDTIELITSLKKTIKSISYEIIVIDNASRKDEISPLKELFYDINNIYFIKSDTNLGFAGGNNLGVDIAKGKYLFFINNDTYILEDNISFLIQRLESNEKIGGVSPKILFHEPFNTIQFAGFTPFTKYTIRNCIIGYGEPNNIKFNSASVTPYVHGAAMMFKKEVIEKVGKMPEIYFLYYEEMDWCEIIKRAGYELWYEPKFVVYHKESRSTGKDSSIKIYYHTRNRLLFTSRNLEKKRKNISILYQLLIANTLHSLKYIFRGKFKFAKAIIKAELDFLIIKNKTL
ncbi:MAG: glycosyltransferase family 2 protein [Bacteroidales bacterium]|nr:glycosyltransferase family 2 protein [Bacteroidales bacterium]MDD4685440.1 glycosyltransferase family 2 protein [Bacteroidales bacterium]